ncbi:MAG TPA: long-chain fatty acid--CoA ligase [Burkholderiaceae bacterium]|nr:long-chain fatty acid--CoA ligase [Burkholderiaceae bacterium]
MKSTMMRTPLSLNPLLERAGTMFAQSELVSRLPDKSLVRHTYAQWAARTKRLALALRDAGLKPGERVATLCWNHHAHLECYFGIPAAGGVMHTLNLRLSPEEIGWIAGHAEDRFLVVDDVLLPLYRQFAPLHRFERVFVFPFSGAPVPTGLEAAGGPELENYEAFLAAVPDEALARFEPVPHDEDAPVAMCYTSGTTGRPKGVVYSHRSTVIHTLMACMPDFWGLSARDVVMPVTPMFHANSWGIPYGCVMTGAKMVFPGPHLHPEDLLDLMQAEPPTFTLGVPTIWLSMIQLHEANPGRWRFPEGMRSLVGGAAVPEALIRAFARHGVSIQQGWGMTETSPVVTLFYEKPELVGRLSGDEWFRRRALAGVLAPLVEMRVVGDEGVQPWDGESVGEIQVAGPTITGGYHGVGADPDKFTEDGWLRTGDVGSLDPHGYLRISDRTKDLIKSGGEWISSVDLENALMGHPAVAEAAVIAVPHPKWQERPLACVVFKPNASATPDELREHLGGQFARWQLPDAFEVVEAIPRTSTGKFWKARLRERFEGYRLPD